MDKGDLAIIALLSWAAAIALSYNVTRPFIRRFQGRSEELGVSDFIEYLAFAIAVFVDVFQAIGIAIREPEATLPRSTMVQGLLLCLIVRCIVALAAMD